MVHRNARGFFGGLAVFPGGKVEEDDVPDGLTNFHDLAHRKAAVRELAEETGILLTATGPVPAPEVREGDFHRFLAETGVVSAVDDLVLVSRWVTPEMAPRRFDTRFYAVACDGAPAVKIDAQELIGYDWIAPDVALQRLEKGELSMFRPTIAHLEWLRSCSTVDEAIETARGAERRALAVPLTVEDGSLLPIQMPAGTR